MCQGCGTKNARAEGGLERRRSLDRTRTERAICATGVSPLPGDWCGAGRGCGWANSKVVSKNLPFGLWYERRCSRTHRVRPDWGCSVLNESLVDSFTEWARCVEPRLRHALTASFGSQLGKDVAADALAHAWVHWDVVSVTENRLGYVYGVGRNMARRSALRHPRVHAGRRRAAPGCRTQVARGNRRSARAAAGRDHPGVRLRVDVE